MPWHNALALIFIAIFLFLILNRSKDSATILGSLASSGTQVINALQGQQAQVNNFSLFSPTA